MREIQINRVYKHFKGDYYLVEDIAIHVAAMLLRSEGKKLDNKQYRSYTSQWINGI